MSIRTTTHITSEHPGRVIKEGHLFKQRNHFKGWRRRWFVLDDHFLHYYLEKENKDGSASSRNSIQIESGTIVVTETNVKVSQEVAYYPFLISHPQSSMVYRLSTTSKEERDSWVAALNSLINKSAMREDDQKSGSSYVFSPGGLEEEEDQRVEEASETVATSCPEDEGEGEKSTDPRAMENQEATLSHIPSHCRDQVEETVESLLTAAYSDDPEVWNVMFNKKGVTGYSKIDSSSSSSSSSAICVKGVCFMPFTIPEVYAVISNPDRRVELDSQLAKYKRLHWFSRHTGVEHLQFKAVWPTMARDFCNLTHWRLMKSGTFVTLGMSEQFPMLCPEHKNFVRAKLLCGGYVLVPVRGGTRVTIVVQSDLGGNLPSSICNLAAQSQPYVLLTLKNILERSQPQDRIAPRPDEMPQAVKYDDIMKLAREHQPDKVDSEKSNELDGESDSEGNAAERLTQQDFIDICASTAHSPTDEELKKVENPWEPLNPEAMRACIPSHCASKVESLVQQIMRDATDSSDKNWNLISNKKNIKSFSKVNGPSGAAFYVKGETFLPFTISEIFEAYFDSSNRPVLDSQLATYTRIKWLSRHVGYEYMQFKGQWPTTARDACNLTHWRVLNDGTLVDIGFSDTIQPENSRFVRAKLQLGGYVFRPVPGGAMAVIVVHSELGGSLPNSVCQMASQHQPATLHKLRELLDRMHARDQSRQAVLSEVLTPHETYVRLLSKAKSLQGDLSGGDRDSTKERDRDSLNHRDEDSGDDLKCNPTAVGSSRNPPTRRPDVLGLTLLLLPVVDWLCELLLSRSVIYRPLMRVSLVLTAYVYLLFYDWVVQWLLQKHLGKACSGSSLRTGPELYRFHVNMSGVEEYLSKSQGTASSGQTSVTAAHVVVKAIGSALSHMRHMHGVVFRDRLYRSPGGPVDVSVTESSGAGDHDGILLHTVHDVASSVSLEDIAREVATSRQQHCRNVSAFRLISRAVSALTPSFLFHQFWTTFSGAVMVCLLALGAEVCPFGAVRVTSVLPKTLQPSDEVAGRVKQEGDSEIEFAVLPMASDLTPLRECLCVPAVTVAVGEGGVRFVPVSHHEKKIVRKFRVLSVSICLHEALTSSPGCSLQEREAFIKRIKHLLYSPEEIFKERKM